MSIINPGILTSDDALCMCRTYFITMATDRCINNERLEFLGDAVIEYLVR